MSAWYLTLILVGHVIAWLAGAVHGYRTGRDACEAEVTGRRQKHRSANCFDCGMAIIAADDEAMACIQCGGRNRRTDNPPCY